MVKAQAKKLERSKICVSYKCHWHIMFEAKWDDMRPLNLHHDIFVEFTFCVCLNLYGLINTEIFINSLPISILDR